ncbi:MAG: hypothetical protein ACKV2T_39900 [Kofleriaceae bacterium]
MKSTSVLHLSFAIAALAGCQSDNESKSATNASSTASNAGFAMIPQADVTKDYAGDIEKLCDVIRLSGAPEDDAQTLTTANWLAANLTTQESRKFLVSIQPLVGNTKADVLDAEAKRVGLARCELSGLWRKPNVVPPS